MASVLAPFRLLRAVGLAVSSQDAVSLLARRAVDTITDSFCSREGDLRILNPLSCIVLRRKAPRGDSLLSPPCDGDLLNRGIASRSDCIR